MTELNARQLRASTIEGAKPSATQGAIDLISSSARILFTNAQSTEKMTRAVGRLADKMGFRASLFPRWDELTLRIEDDCGRHFEIIAASPAGVDMNKVARAMDVIDQVCDSRMEAAAGRSALELIAKLPSVSTARFAVMAGAGAAALAVIFGAAHLLSLLVIAVSAGAGACLRRWLAARSHNLFLQPFCAALLAGVIGAIFVRMQLSSPLRLVAVCPCMVLVPGPHFLNGAIDLVRGRLGLGAARIAYASLITAVICAGLLIGLALLGVALPPSGPARFVPIAYDVIAAGVAVAAYGTFFSMSWRALLIPMAIGMLAHASRWVAISVLGSGVVTGALLACVLVGIVAAPLADYLRFPFAALAFTSVVSLIPGVYLFRMAGGMVELAAMGTKAPQDLIVQVLADGSTAFLIILAMVFGLIVPKMCFDHVFAPPNSRRGTPSSQAQ